MVVSSGAWPDRLARGGVARGVVSAKCGALVREGPSLSTALIGQPLPRRARIIIAAARGDRLRVEGGGWVSSRCIRPAPFRIGFCFLVYGVVEFRDVWSHFLDGVDPSRYGVFVHSKRPSLGGGLAGAVVLEDPEPTAWGEISLVKATARLFRAARDDGCDALVLLSDTMLPLAPFEVLAGRLRSTVFQVQTAPSEEEFEARAGNRKMIAGKLPPDTVLPPTVTKANMFFALDAASFTRLDAAPRYDAFSTIWVGASDEYYWINMARAAGLGYREGNFVYCSSDYAGVTAAELHDIDERLLEELGRLDFLFVRKVRSIPAMAEYLASITSRRARGPPPRLPAATSAITGHVWGEVE